MDAEQQMNDAAEAQLALIQSTEVICGIIDGMKTNLESKGWSTPTAEQASIAVMGPGLATWFATALTIGAQGMKR